MKRQRPWFRGMLEHSDAFRVALVVDEALTENPGSRQKAVLSQEYDRASIHTLLSIIMRAALAAGWSFETWYDGFTDVLYVRLHDGEGAYHLFPCEGRGSVDRCREAVLSLLSISAEDTDQADGSL